MYYWVTIVVPWMVHLAGRSPAPWRQCNAAIDGMSLLMTVTRVSLYRVDLQFSMPRAVVSVWHFVSGSHYSNYLYLYYVRWASPPSLNCYLRLISFLHFLFEWVDEITILPFTGALVLWRARQDSGTSRTAPASFAHIHRSLLCLSLSLLVRTFVLYSLSILLCDCKSPILCISPKPLLS